MDEARFRTVRSAGLRPLIETVQANCHLSDARHARNMTLCTYLLEMRELYRWERGIALTEPLPRAAVGAWLSEREALWAKIEEEGYRPLPVGGALVDPFDADVLNRELERQHCVYGAGVGRFGKPQFFLGALEREERRDGVRILVSGREYARDLAPALAALRDDTIYVRLESLERVLWEKIEAWERKRSDGPLKSALVAHGFERDPAAALKTMATAEAETLILHELGEHRVAQTLSPAWERMLAGFARRPAELFARAVRDHLADCMTTLPALLERNAKASLQLWFAGLDGMRRELFPRIASAHDSWCAGDRGLALSAAVALGREHWRDVCARVLDLHERRGSEGEAAIEALARDPVSRL